MGQRALGLVERSLVRLGIDLHDRLALFHLLALSELDGKQLAADARLDRDAVIGRDGSQASQVNGHRLLFGRNDLYRHGTRHQSGGLVGGICRGLLLVLVDAPNDEPHGDGEDEVNNNPDPGTPSAGRL